MSSSESVFGDIREGSSPDFCPPTQEGITLSFTDEQGDALDLEFLGILLFEGGQYGFFFPVDADTPALSSGEVVVLEVVGFDEENDPCEFELVEDEALLKKLYARFMEATADLYRFE
jgi:hypothetical protein